MENKETVLIILTVLDGHELVLINRLLSLSQTTKKIINGWKWEKFANCTFSDYLGNSQNEVLINEDG